MTLTDTGPLVALVDENDPHNLRVVEALAAIRSWPLATTEACLTEVMYLTGKTAGRAAQSAIWRFFEDGSLSVLPHATEGTKRAKAYMERFSDIPCDYADATLLVAAEDTGLRRIFTLDKHFYAYRLAGGDYLDVIP